MPLGRCILPFTTINAPPGKSITCHLPPHLPLTPTSARSSPLSSLRRRRLKAHLISIEELTQQRVRPQVSLGLTSVDSPASPTRPDLYAAGSSRRRLKSSHRRDILDILLRHPPATVNSSASAATITFLDLLRPRRPPFSTRAPKRKKKPPHFNPNVVNANPSSSPTRNAKKNGQRPHVSAPPE